MSEPGDESRFDAAYPARDRYRASDEGSPVSVRVDGVVCSGEVLGRNGPRTQVRLVIDGSTYVRWFNTEELTEEP